MPSIASLEVAITANTTALEAGFGRANSLLEQLQRNSGAADMSFGKLTGSFAAGTVIANAFTGAIGAVSGVLQNAAGATLSLASRLEQARIGFSTMLGGVQQADQFIGQLQQKAESTAFNFPGIQQVAQSFLAMGVAGSRVIPIIDDISNALSAAGHGGDTAMLQRVGQSLSEIQAQGKLSAEQIRELSRDGIAVLPLLSEAFGKTAGEVRKMAETGQISADQFFAAFHSEVAMHYGDIQAQQARTWAVAASNVEDILGRLSTQTFKELTDALTSAALQFNDFLHSEGFLSWAGDVKQAIHEVMLALAPLGAAFAAAMGSGGAPTPLGPSAVPLGPSPEEVRKAMEIPPEVGQSVENYTRLMKDAAAAVKFVESEMAPLKERMTELKAAMALTAQPFDLKLVGLHDQMDALNLDIAAVKDKWTAVLDPLQKQQVLLSRLGEDTKTAFTGILDPLKASLEQTSRQIADAKAGYEGFARPIQAQIDGIERANKALHTQLTTEQDIADLALRQQRLKSLGDPNVRGDIMAKQTALDFARQDLQNQKDLLDLGNAKGNKDKQIADIQKQLDDNKRQQIQLDQQANGLVDRQLAEQVARQAVINEAAKEHNSIVLEGADIAARQQVDPMKAKLQEAQDALKAFTDPLIVQQAALQRAIQDVGDTEAATMKPIIEAQAALARQIQDTNAKQAAELKPMEDKQKSITAEISRTETARKHALAPLEAENKALEQQLAALDLQKQKIEAAGAAAKANADEAKARAADAAGAAGVPALGGEPFPVAEPGPAAAAHAQVIPSETITSINALATSIAGLNAQIVAFNASGGMTVVTNSLLVLGTVLAGAAIVNGLAGLGLGLAAAIAWAGQVAAGFGMLAGAAEAVGVAIAGVSLPFVALGAVIGLFVAGLVSYATNFNGFRDTTNAAFQNVGETVTKVFTDMGTNIHDGVELTLRDSREGGGNPFPQIAEWFSGFPGAVGTAVAAVEMVFTNIGSNLSIAAALMTNDVRNGGSNPFPALLDAFGGFKDLVTPVIASIVTAFDPLAKVLASIGEAITTMPSSIPGWISGLIATIRGGGGGGGSGAVQTAFRPGQSSGASDIAPGSIVMMGGTKDEMIRNAARQFGLDEATFFKQISEESGNSLDVNLTSAAGARGPGQFMPGTGAEAAKLLGVNIDEFWSSAEEQILGAAALMRQYLQTYGNYQDALTAYNAGPGAVGGGLPSETVKYHSDILGSAGANVLASFHPAGPATRTQFQLVDQGLTADAAAAFCGPYAAMLFANAVGRYPTAQEAQQLAAKVGWTPGAGMAGIQSELALMQSMGLNVVQQMATPSNINAALGAGHPIALSTPAHYFEATGGTAEGGLQVGATGTALKGGKAVMTLAEIEALSGPLQGIIVLQDQLNTAQGAGAQAAAAQAAAQAGLTRILAGGVAATGALGTAQQQTVTWAQQMAEQEAALNATLAQQVPPGRAATDAMKQLGSVLGPVERQVAAGQISADTLRGTLLDLAKATGLADKPWQDFATGAMDANAAMDELINLTATLGPEFQAVADYEKTAGSNSNEAALRWFQAAKSYAAAKDVLAKAPDVPAVPTVAGAGAAAGKTGPSPIDAQATSFDALKPKIDAANGSFQQYQAYLVGLTTDPLQEQEKAWATVTEAITRAGDGVKQFGDYLDHDFKLKVDTSDVPDWLIPHSPPPLVKGLEQVAAAFEHVNRMTVPLGGSLDLRPLATAARQPSGGHSGSAPTVIERGDVHVHLQSFMGTRDELISAVYEGLLKKKRHTGRLGLGDKD